MQVFVVTLSELERGPWSSEGRLESDFFSDGEEFGVYGGSMAYRMQGRSSASSYHFVVELDGAVEVECDRCLGHFQLPLHCDAELHIMRVPDSAGEYEGDDWTIGPEQEDVDLTGYVRDSVYLNLPMRRYHGMAGSDASACDATMQERIVNGECQGHGVCLGDTQSALLAQLREQLCREVNGDKSN